MPNEEIPRLNWIKPSDELPQEGTYVLVRHNRYTWLDRTDQEGVNYIVLVRRGSRWDQFGPDVFETKEIDSWAYFPRVYGN